MLHALKTTGCFGLLVTATTIEKPVSNVSIDGSDSVAVRGADMWPSGRGGGVACGCGGTEGNEQRGGGQPWGHNRVPTGPDSPCVLVNQGPIWQQSNERSLWALSFFFYNIGSIIIKKKKNGGKGLKSNSESVVRLQRTVPSEPDVPELQEWFDCSAALKKNPKINKNIKSNIVGSALLEVRRERVGSLAKT